MGARIFKRTKNAMQSGRANGDGWLLEFEQSEPSLPTADIGWSGSHDTAKQIRLKFSTMEQAIDYAKQLGLEYIVLKTPQLREMKPKSYADNFAFSRVIPWTH